MKKAFSAGFFLFAVILGALLVVFLRPDVSERFGDKFGGSPSALAAGETGSGSLTGASQTAVGEREKMALVEVPPDKRQMIGIKDVAAAVIPLRKTLRTVGRVEFDETKLSTVNVRVEGWVEKLYADHAGKYVEKGAPLAEIYSPELMAVQLEYINLIDMQSNVGFRSQRNVEFSWGDRYGTVGRVTAYDLEALFKVAKQKLSLWEIPEGQIKELETTKKPLRTLTIKSPASGYVFQKPVFRGTRVAPGDKLFDIVDLSTVWVMADIYEYEIPFVKAGQNARITLSYYPQKEFFAKVDFLYPSLSGQTRTAKARFVVPNPDLLLKPQMFADVELQLELGDRLAIPETAILDTGTRKIVYVDSGNGFFSARRIKVGDRADGMVEVASGLDAGDKVASSAVFLIDSEAKLKDMDQ